MDSTERGILVMRPATDRVPSDVTEALYQHRIPGWTVVSLPDGRFLRADGEDISSWACFEDVRPFIASCRVHAILRPAGGGGTERLPGIIRGKVPIEVHAADLMISAPTEGRRDLIKHSECRPPWRILPMFEIETRAEFNVELGVAMKVEGAVALVGKHRMSRYEAGASATWFQRSLPIPLDRDPPPGYWANRIGGIKP